MLQKAYESSIKLASYVRNSAFLGHISRHLTIRTFAFDDTRTQKTNWCYKGTRLFQLCILTSSCTKAPSPPKPYRYIQQCLQLNILQIQTGASLKTLCTSTNFCHANDDPHDFLFLICIREQLFRQGTKSFFTTTSNP